MHDMGFIDFRVRMRGENALIQVTENQIAEAFAREEEIRTALSEMYDEINIDENPRVSK